MKLLLIDSRVFAEEVEPTGAVPMELSLERCVRKDTIQDLAGRSRFIEILQRVEFFDA